jgi:CubicO group peptidase (beta-lactamase class C family)
MTQLASAIGDVYEYTTPEQLDDGWACADLADAGIDKEKMCEFIKRIVQGKHDDIHSLLIVKDGKLILEEYFATKGKRFGPVVTGLFRNKLHHLASTTKSVLSTLIGISIDRGQISSVDESIHPFLPHYSILFTEEKKQIQIKHMLTMTAGFEWEQFKYPWDDPRNNGTAMYRCGDVIAYVLGRPMVSEPGETFTYSNGVPTVMGAVLKNACGMEADAFAEKVLFGPLGISKYLWTRYPDGSVQTDGGLALCSRDLARIGQLFFNRGKWDGKQIVSENWIEESTKRRITLKGFMSWGYGYHWMQVDMKYKGNMIHSYFVPGDGGQLLSVFPGLNMVIVFTAGNYGSDVKAVCYNMIYYNILPAVLTETE